MMANRAYWPTRKGLTKEFLGKTFYLGKAWDFTSGYGWHCQIFDYTDDTSIIGYGFDKKSKFLAVKKALIQLKQKPMTKSLIFENWVRESITKWNFDVEIEQALSFYSQPFEVGMLANPIKNPIYENYENGDDCISSAFLTAEKKWEEAQAKVLFDGLEATDIDIHPKGEFYQKWSLQTFMHNKDGSRFTVHNYKTHISQEILIPKALSHFISDCERAGIDLEWNEQTLKQYPFLAQ